MSQSERAELELMLDRIAEQIVRPVIVEMNVIEAAEARDRSQVLQSLVAQLFGAS